MPIPKTLKSPYSCHTFICVENAALLGMSIKTRARAFKIDALKGILASYGHIGIFRGQKCMYSSGDLPSRNTPSAISPANKLTHKLSRKEKSKHDVEQIVQYMHKRGTLYPDASEIEGFLHELGAVDGDTSQSNTTKLIYHARRIARGRLDHSVSQLSKEHEHLIQKYVESEGALTSIPQAIEAVQQMVDAPRHLLKRHLENVRRSMGNKTVTKEQRRTVLSHLEQCSPPYNVPAMCDDLQQELQLPRTTIQQTIYNGIRSLHLKTVTEDQKRIVRRHIHESSHPTNIPLLCDELLLSMDMSREVLYAIVRSMVRTLHSRKVTSSQRQIVNHHVSQSTHPNEIIKICDELRNRLSLPRDVLYKLVVNQSMRVAMRKLTNDHKRIVRNHVQLSRHPHDIVALCDELQDKLPLPRNVLYHLVANNSERLANKQQRGLTKQQKQLIKEHIEQAETDDVDTLRDELQDTLNTLPRDKLREFIRNVVSWKSSRNFTQEMRELVNQHVINSAHPENVATLCDELQEEFREVNRKALYQLVHSCSVRHFTSQLTEKQKHEMREWNRQMVRDVQVTNEQIDDVCTQWHEKWRIPKFVILAYVRKHLKDLKW
eukprot:CAMPEP_0117436554 /NCGR_PEP_ID=MMETSP0759-20121206/1067_1 /TAXON_ID=63605 /ORGANISM="Percolomonas cosmopolitus, Strain WS" /LENGTH=602 /DNA_ID=CAMNT_0005228157 /DNA_START=20 /DNA_END=1825 /DNA_ORIENTATION=-